jgi:hypothetical protein
MPILFPLVNTVLTFSTAFPALLNPLQERRIYENRNMYLQ